MDKTKANITFFVGLTGLDAPVIDGPGISISDNVKLVTDRSYISRLVGGYLEHLGNVEHGYLANSASGILYSRTEVDFAQADPSELINGHIIAKFHEIHTWQVALWMMRDHAINHDTAWAIAKGPQIGIANNNFWGNIYFRCDGTAPRTKYTREELGVQQRRKVLKADEVSVGIGAVPLGQPGASNQHVTKLKSGSARVQRFLYFVDGARSTQDIAIKVLNYCSALEALTSSSNAELTHQVAERVAITLGNDAAERLEIYRNTKKAYAFRSKAVHGATFKDAEADALLKSSMNLDSYCRELTFKAYGEEQFKKLINSDNQEFASGWQKALFEQRIVN